MLVIEIDRKKCVFLCGLTGDHIEQVRLSIIAAMECDIEAMRELAIDLHVGVLCFYSEIVLVIDRHDIVFLMVIMIHTATEKMIRHNARLLNEIIEGLARAVKKMRIV